MVRRELLLLCALLLACSTAFRPPQWPASRHLPSIMQLHLSLAPPPFDVFPSYRVSNLATSVAFYENVLGMRRVGGAGDPKVAQLSFGGAGGNGVELTEDAAAVAKGTGDVFAGIGVTLPDAASIMRKAEQFGGKIVRAFDEYGYGAAIIPDEDEMKVNAVRLGCVQDPDGYAIEVTEGIRAEPLRKVVLRVLDTEETVAFYSEHLGMHLLRRRSNVNSRPKHASICSFVSHETSELEGTMLELVYNFATERLQVGAGVAHLGLSSKKVPAGARAQISTDPNGLSIVVF